MQELWKKFPPSTIQNHVLKPGGAFRKEYEYEDEGEKPRYFFILNRSPEQDKQLVIVTATTRIEPRKKARESDPKVLVEIKPHEYGVLKRRSVVDCASAKLWEKKKLMDDMEEKRIEPLERLPKDILEKMRFAIRRAKTLPRETKRLVLGDETF